jgi:hypothetical protein
MLWPPIASRYGSDKKRRPDRLRNVTDKLDDDGHRLLKQQLPQVIQLR